MENMKIGYIGIVEYNSRQLELFSEKPGDILTGILEVRKNANEDSYGDLPHVQLISMKRIKYIEEE